MSLMEAKVGIVGDIFSFSRFNHLTPEKAVLSWPTVLPEYGGVLTEIIHFFNEPNGSYGG